MPAPPYASGIGAPRKPCSPIRAKTSRWTSPFSSQSRMWGRISASAKARRLCWTRRFSSVRAKSTMGERFLSVALNGRPSYPGRRLAGMLTRHDEPIGREAEAAVIGAFLDRAATGPAALVLTGPAGIGKSAVWRAGIAEASRRGFRTLVTHAVEAEAELAF